MDQKRFIFSGDVHNSNVCVMRECEMLLMAKPVLLKLILFNVFSRLWIVVIY